MLNQSFAEEGLLGGLLLKNELFHEVAPKLSAAHFTSGFRSRVWEVIRDRILAGDPVDAVTVAEDFPQESEAVIDLAMGTFTAANVTTYAGIVHENWRRREAVGIAARLMSAAREGQDGAVDAAIGSLLALNASVTEHEFTGKQMMAMAWAAVEQAHQNGGKLPGITTGLTALDDILGGFHNSDLTVIGARPAMGKTALMMGMAEAAAASGKRVGVVSAEQPALQLGLRRLSLTSGVAATRMRNGSFDEEDWGRMGAQLAQASARHMWVLDRSAVTLDELVGTARKWKHQHGIEILFVDYAQRIRVPGAERITEVSEVARTLKDIGRTLDVPVVSLAQVKAAVDSRTNDKRPNAGDLANSDELTREADQILMLYRDEVYNRDTQKQGVAEILIEKNRHGPVGFKEVRFNGETMRFSDLNESF